MLDSGDENACVANERQRGALQGAGARSYGARGSPSGINAWGSTRQHEAEPRTMRASQTANAPRK
jgi:hypothetical protein